MTVRPLGQLAGLLVQPDPRLASRLCYDRSQLPSIKPSLLHPSLSSRLRELGLGFHLSGKCSWRSGRKQRKISVVSGVRAISTTSDDVSRSPGTRLVESRHLAPVPDDAADDDTLSSDFPQFQGRQFCRLDSRQCRRFHRHFITTTTPRNPVS